MLIEFSVGNYLSFKEKVTFSMVATDLGAKTELDYDNTFQVDKELTLLKSAAIYGANASGKSNLIKAIGFMKWFVINSSSNTQITDLINVSEFRLSTETLNKPSFFEIVFLLDKKIYRYGFELTKKEIISEWLYYTPTTREYNYFNRKQQKINILKKFSEGERLESKTRPNALFLSVVAQFNGKISEKILTWFRETSILSGVSRDFPTRYTAKLLREKQYHKNIITLIKNLDLNINDIKTKDVAVSSAKIPQEVLEMFLQTMKEDGLSISSSDLTMTEIITIHKKYNRDGKIIGLEEFDLESNESEGTQKLFAFAAPIVTTLEEGRILIIDELDARLHPLITKSIIELFNSEDINTNNAQLIFTTHDTNILSKTLFRPDQIWFTEKDKYEATDLYSLVEYKIDENSSFEDDYINGRYGAIPYIGNFKELVDYSNRNNAKVKK